MEKKKRKSENSVPWDTPHCHNALLQHIGAGGFVIKCCHSTVHLSQRPLSVTLKRVTHRHNVSEGEYSRTR